MTAAVIVAGGSGRRMGFDKILAPLCGRPVLAHSIAAFELVPDVGGIVVVASAGTLAAVTALVEEEHFTKVIGVVEGGAERHDSVWNGLEAAGRGFDTVAVHDGARPLITPLAISRCLEAVREHGAAALAHRVAETVKRAASDGTVGEPVDREGLWAMETPQVFARELLVDAYRRVRAGGEAVTDEVSALRAIGARVWLVENSEPNFKLTVPGDLVVARAVLEVRASAGEGRAE